MSATIESLPSEVPALRALLLEKLTVINKLERDIVTLQHQLLLKNKEIFGKRSERIESLLQIPLLTVPESEAKREKEPEKIEVKAHKRTARNGRAPLPKNLPRERIEIEPEEANDPKLKLLSEEITEVLEFVPASFKIIEIVRKKYVNPESGEIFIGEIPAKYQPIAKARPGAGLIAHILVSKYADHLPLNRQQGMYERHGVHIHRSTLYDWTVQGAELLKPLGEAIKGEILRSYDVKADETPVVQQDKESKSYFWGYHARDPGLVYYQYAETRSSKIPLEFFKDFEGYVQADAYQGYDKLFEQRHIIEVGCWAHARRKFVEALPTAKVRCGEILKLISKLYALEREATSPRQRLKVRIKESYPVLKNLKAKLQAWSLQELPQSPLALAMRYVLNQWRALTRYIFDPYLDIDNNAMERLIRPLTIGRNNWLFTGSEGGGQVAALIFGLINSCKLNKVEPYAYLRDVITRLATKNFVHIEDLLPNRWAKKNLPA